jgi:hypothetical protein
VKRPAKKIRTWLTSLIRKRAEHLGRVEAPDRKAAKGGVTAPRHPPRAAGHTVLRQVSPH